MFRRTLLVAALLALCAAVAAARPAAEGHWLLAQITPTGEFAQCILKLETKDGKPTPVVVWAPANTAITVSDFKHGAEEIAFTLKTVRTIPARGDQAAREMPPQIQTFVGVHVGEGKPILGSLGDDRLLSRVKLSKTDKEKLEPNEMAVRGEPVAPYTKATQLANRPLTLSMQAQRETDAEKKKELQQQAAEARKAAEEVPALHREVVAKHADSPAAFDSALYLIRSAPRVNLTADEAANLAKLIEKHAATYGPRFLQFQMLQAGELLVGQKGLEAVGLTLVEPLAKSMTGNEKPSAQVRLLNAYKSGLEKANRAEDLKAIDAKLAKLEGVLDQEYLATVPPFKPEPYAGRSDKSANQTVVMELFTGAQCPPCVAADVGFDALEKAYSGKDLILVQYHMHIPGPDPLTNPASVARWDYYRAKFPEGIRGTPSTLFNGKPAAGGGGGMAASENKHKQFRAVIDPLLEKSTPVKLAGKATRNGDKIEAAIELEGATPAGEDLRLRFIVVEEKVKYVGGNGLRFHHQVVRAMPGGPAGFVVKEPRMRQVVNADLAEVRQGLTKYLDEYAVNTRPFPYKARPMEMGHLKLIALVQNDQTREIVQAAMFDVEGK